MTRDHYEKVILPLIRQHVPKSLRDTIEEGQKAQLRRRRRAVERIETAIEMRPAGNVLAIIASVCRRHRINPADLMAEGRPTRIVACRDEVWWTIRLRTKLSYVRIGAIFGRDHSTVITGVRRHTKRLAAQVQP
jgi:chromosomal replication initiation ATPase DnaA